MKGAQSQISPRFILVTVMCCCSQQMLSLKNPGSFLKTHTGYIVLNKPMSGDCLYLTGSDHVFYISTSHTGAKVGLTWEGVLDCCPEKTWAFSLRRAARWPNHARMNLTEVMKRYWGETPVTKWWLRLDHDGWLIDWSFNWDNWSNGQPIRSHHFVDVRLPRTCSHKA